MSQPSDPIYILYGGGVSRAAGPQMVLEEAGLEYELRVIDIAKGEHRTPEFLKLNPAGYVPALKTPEGEVLHEAAAIMLYLADHHRLTELAPAPDDRLRGRFLARLFYIANDIQPPMKRMFYPERIALRGSDIAAVKSRARAAAEERWGVIDRWLGEDGPYLLGDRFSIADIYLAVWAAYGFERDDDIREQFPAVGRCFEQVAARPACGPVIASLRPAPG